MAAQDLSPLSFAALAASGPLWDKNQPKDNERRCSHCSCVKRIQCFSKGSTVCQQCVAANKVRRVQESKKKYAAKKRQQALEARNANVDD